MVELAMRQSNGNQTQAAKLLDISRDALRYKLKKFGLSTVRTKKVDPTAPLTCGLKLYRFTRSSSAAAPKRWVA